MLVVMPPGRTFRHSRRLIRRVRSRGRLRAPKTFRNSRWLCRAGANCPERAGGHAAQEDFPPFPLSHLRGAIQRSSPDSEDFPQVLLALPCWRKLPRARRWSCRAGGLSAIPAVSSAGCGPEVVSGLRRLSAIPAGSAVPAQTAPRAPVVLPRRRTFRNFRCLIRGVRSRGRLRVPKTFRNSRRLCRAGANCPVARRTSFRCFRSSRCPIGSRRTLQPMGSANGRRRRAMPWARTTASIRPGVSAGIASASARKARAMP